MVLPLLGHRVFLPQCPQPTGNEDLESRLGELQVNPPAWVEAAEVLGSSRCQPSQSARPDPLAGGSSAPHSSRRAPTLLPPQGSSFEALISSSLPIRPPRRWILELAPLSRSRLASLGWPPPKLLAATSVPAPEPLAPRGQSSSASPATAPPLGDFSCHGRRSVPLVSRHWPRHPAGPPAADGASSSLVWAHRVLLPSAPGPAVRWTLRPFRSGARAIEALKPPTANRSPAPPPQGSARPRGPPSPRSQPEAARPRAGTSCVPEATGSFCPAPPAKWLGGPP